MKYKLMIPGIALTILLLAACAPEPIEKDQRTPLENSLSTQLDALEKSATVEQSLQDAAQARQQEIDEKGG